MLTGSQMDGTSVHGHHGPHLQQLDEQHHRERAASVTTTARGLADTEQAKVVEQLPPEQGPQPRQPGQHGWRRTVLLFRNELTP